MKFIIDEKGLEENSYLSVEEVLPKRATDGSAGYDFVYTGKTPLIMEIGDTAIVNSYVQIHLEKGYSGKLYIRSSTGIKKGINLMNGTGLIDSDFRNNISLALIKTHGDIVTIQPGERIAQLEITKYIILENEVLPTEKRVGGIGSTNK